MDGAAPVIGAPSREKLMHALHEAAERLGEVADVTGAADQNDPRSAKAARILRTLADRLRDEPRAPSDTTRSPALSTASSAAPAISRPTAPAGPDVVEGRDITIQFDGKRCIHARFCVTLAPATFLADTDGPWILPDASVAEDVAAVVRQCPSGALTYRRKDGHDEIASTVNLVTLRENGPYAVRGDLSIDGAPAGFRATLCRCGASKNKPFCDKSHKYAGFIATGEPASLPSQQLLRCDGLLAISPEPDGPLGVRGNLEIVSGTGRTVARLQKARLCRCGGSANKPFCDDTHKRIGFQAG